jgi:lysophospholipase L1-like esterase
MNTNVSAKRILIYGDSYTFGKIPGGLRFDSATRFTGVTQSYLGSEYEIIEEGLRGRTISGENGFVPKRDGLAQFDGIIGSHLPLDLVFIFLGLNDTNSSRKSIPEEIVAPLIKYIRGVSWWSKHLGFPKPRIALVIPPTIDEPASDKALKNIFNGSGEKIIAIQKLIKQLAEDNKVFSFDASKVVTVSQVDGIHLDAENNRLLGRALAQFIKEVL